MINYSVFVQMQKGGFVMFKDCLILGEDQYYSMNSYETQVNNNVLVVGAAGSGKTRSLVIPNVLQATGSYIISDPKGMLYKNYADYLRDRGYVIKVLDLISPKKSTNYNFFHYIRTERDIIKAGNMLGNALINLADSNEPFWENAAEMLMIALIAYLVLHRPKEEHTLEGIMKLTRLANINERDSAEKTILDLLFDDTHRQEPNNFAYRQYQKFRVGAGKTLKSVIITLNAKFKDLDFDELNKMMSKDRMNIPSIGEKKTAVFVIVSDMERSMDCVANMFYSQCLEVLCSEADKKTGGRLKNDVRFILDDFATNCVIDDFPKKISAFRSRGISAMIMLQSEQQLDACYPRQGNIVIGNCDNYVYLGGNDLCTANSIARRCNVPIEEVLYMPIGMNWLIRRGQKPILGRNFELDTYYSKLDADVMEEELEM